MTEDHVKPQLFKLGLEGEVEFGQIFKKQANKKQQNIHKLQTVEDPGYSPHV